MPQSPAHPGPPSHLVPCLTSPYLLFVCEGFVTALLSKKNAFMSSSSCGGVMADAGADAMDDRALCGSSKMHV